MTSSPQNNRAGGALGKLAARWAGAAPAASAVPARVRAAILAQQDDSERLAGWIQLGIVVFFGVLYWRRRRHMTAT